ncbi:outer membrane protein assembly factor BamD [Tamlana sp. 2_MG-2023]|uniref:outer membrane protein assembly factor BamD n=1 Tax=unclassified Tamlana TaxID=2614803 RepID=UPI0026E45994|nr:MULTISPECIES: outer membrane protein assembly factor BamD [unclassified Tamlana]MDO6759102.1 outer membrane protein assembly factor BamD [Tamlana sp. 2_MG-2023]MDO6789801.1 outer membrane protein assembly factor BamD [Tamlana sp. 1_MG-2023]
MNKLFYLLVVFTVLTSCSEYHKTLKAEDISEKFKMGETLYNEGEYNKANTLFAQIVPNYRGKPQAEKLMYLYAKSYYYIKDYYVAGYQLEKFASSYPKSEKLEEASFLSAKSYYLLSPVYSKDQSQTTEAIEKLQEFINLFPESEYVSEANALTKELSIKLEKKAFEIAKQYNTISDFEAAMKSFDNFIFENPGSTFLEDAYFYKFDSAYKLAINSIERKKKTRLETAEEYYIEFKKDYADSKYQEDVEDMAEELKEELENYSSQS